MIVDARAGDVAGFSHAAKPDTNVGGNSPVHQRTDAIQYYRGELARVERASTLLESISLDDEFSEPSCAGTYGKPSVRYGVEKIYPPVTAAPSMRVDGRAGDWRTMDFPPLVSDPDTVPATAKIGSA